MEDEGSPSAVSGENASKAPESITGWMESTVVTASQTTLGQMLFKLVDSFLWVVEKSTQWSLPAQEINAEENGKVFGKIELVRPLPWILFLPGLVILRIVRVALNAGAFVLRYPRIEPSGMVKFLQKSRRRLRALNIKAIKSARRKMGNKVATPDEKSTTESAESPMHTEAKRKFSQVSSDEESSDESDNETLLAKLDRLALEDSTDDPDFDPTNCSTESSTSNSENEVGQNTSVTDVTEVQKELTEIVKDNKEKPTIFPLDKDTCMATTEEMVAGITGVDSSESKLQTISRTTNDFINGEVSSSLPPMPPVSTPPPPPPPPPEVTNGVVSEHKTFNRRSSNAPPAPQQRGVAAKEHAPATQEKKISPRKKPGRKDVK
ncbi:uncharacterized protein DDB_G0284459-like isoform X3 [Hylaeus anthracinus]|uniref:uncharacterized protein DDB_G0284459-like isoform X3 n=1 Tax=Hylaeus anthracinus TaxID=313031 RepID=UPI0023B9A4E7|nr:uncharacterized protein DDB_G0284459-like isoform X3 [Hylaeus anthracinus]